MRARRWHGRCSAAGMPTTKKKKAPWERPNPKGTKRSKPLTAAQKSKAKASAERAGRRYPSLVDNMNAAKKKNEKRAASKS